MSEPQYCRRCGSMLPADAPRGVCPRCMLRVGFETATAPDDDTLATDPDATAAGAALGADRSSPSPPSPEALAARFPHLEVLELLGRGGMGVVYKARHRGLDRLVALKILPPDVGRAAGFAERFTREARALARLSHPNIVAVHDFGQADGLYFLLMEYVDGTNLRSLIGAGGAGTGEADGGGANVGGGPTGRLPPAQALAIVPQICDALQYAHDEGVVHRDIKPENILLDRRGRVKVADFGLAKLVGAAAARPEYALTATNNVLGTPRYMAPEQMETPQAVDHRADIYSLGVVLYEMLTGEVPMGRFRGPSERVAAVDARLDDVVLRALEREPVRRYQHASEVKTAVATASEPIVVPPLPPLPSDPPATARAWPAARVPPAVPASPTAAAPVPGPAFVLRPARRNWALRAAVGFGLVVLLIPCLGVLLPRYFARRPLPPPRPAGLSAAVDRGDPAEVRQLLRAGAAPDERDDANLTPLMRAAAKGNTGVVNALLDNGAAADARDDIGETALMKAAAGGYADTVTAMLSRGGPTAAQWSDVSTRSRTGSTALGLAAGAGSKATALLLLSAPRAQVDAPGDADGRTPLMIAAAGGHAGVVEMLLLNNADPHARDADGVTPLLAAEAGGHAAAAALLRRVGATVDEDRLRFARAYMLALDGRHADAVPLLEAVAKSFTGPSVPWAVPIRGWTYTIPTPRGLVQAVLAECHEKAGQPAPARAAYLSAKAMLPPVLTGVELYRRRQRSAGKLVSETYSVQPQALSDHAARPDRPLSVGVEYREVTTTGKGQDERTGYGFNAGIAH